MGLIDDLKPGPVALDTQIFIYFIEEERRFLPLVKPLFEANRSRRTRGGDIRPYFDGSLGCTVSVGQFGACRSL